MREHGYAEIREFDRLLREHKLEHRIRYAAPVLLPIVGHRLDVPYAYRNGLLNLVLPKRFSAHESTALHTAYDLAVDGDLLSRYPEGGIKRKLVVIAAYEAPQRNIRQKIHNLLSEFGVRDVSENELPDFVAEIEREAHE